MAIKTADAESVIADIVSEARMRLGAPGDYAAYEWAKTQYAARAGVSAGYDYQRFIARLVEELGL